MKQLIYSLVEIFLACLEPAPKPTEKTLSSEPKRIPATWSSRIFWPTKTLAFPCHAGEVHPARTRPRKNPGRARINQAQNPRQAATGNRRPCGLVGWSVRFLHWKVVSLRAAQNGTGRVKGGLPLSVKTSPVVNGCPGYYPIVDLIWTNKGTPVPGHPMAGNETCHAPARLPGPLMVW